MGKMQAAGQELRSYEELDKDMQRVNDQLIKIAEEQHAKRLALLKLNEGITRETVDVEVDIRRLENLQEQLSHQLDTSNEQRVDLEGTCRRLQRGVGDLSREDEGLTEENDRLGTERTRLDEEVNRLKRLRADYISAVAKFKTEKEGK